MKRFFFLTVLVYLSILHVAAINYNGAALVMNEDFTRTECGTAYKNVLKEVSDGGVKAIRLGRKSTTTSIENQSIKENVYKVLHNGQVYIVRGSKMYTLHG